MNEQYLLMNKLDGITIKLFPNKTQATEQIMNALHLNLKSNYSDVVKNVLKVKHLYIKHNDSANLEELLHFYQPMLEQYEMGIINDPNEAILFNANFDTNLTFNSPDDKQQYINEWFRVNTGRVNFDGLTVTFSIKFDEELAAVARKQLNAHKLNPQDDLMYNFIVPSVSDIDTQAIDELKQAFNNFIQHVEKSLGEKNELV